MKYLKDEISVIFQAFLLLKKKARNDWLNIKKARID
jgi:hypothetical protein